MSNTYLAHIADRALNRPLMIMPDKLAVIASVLEGRIGLTEAVQPAADVPLPDASRFVGKVEQDASGNNKPYRTVDGTAIIPIIGTLVGRGGWLSAMSGIQSYENIKFALSAAVKDDSVASIILDVDSPGGEAVGAFEVADAVRAAAGSKPTFAVATGLCCSAAYAIASAATQVITTKSSVVGSIGVVMLHADYSHALHEKGIVPTLIYAGKKKTDGSPYKPLTDDVKASLKSEIEKFNSLFISTVVEGRSKLTAKAVREMEAGTYVGADAVKVGLADAVGTFEGVLERLAAKSPRKLSKSSAPPTGVLLEAPQHAAPVATATGARSPEDRAALERAAGGDTRLAQLVSLFASWTHERVSQEHAVAAIEIAKSNLAHQDHQQNFVNGLYMPNMAVKGGPLFVEATPATAADHGWSDVIAAVNKKH